MHCTYGGTLTSNIQVCNNITECTDGSDESHTLCLFAPEFYHTANAFLNVYL